MTGPSSKTLLGWLWRTQLKRYGGVVFVAFLLMALEGSMLGALSYLVKPMFDTVFAANAPEAAQSAILLVALAAGGIFLIRALASFGQRVIMSWVGLRVSTSLQSDLVGHMLTLDGKFFQENPPGTLIERTRGDAEASAGIWGLLITAFGRDLIALVSLLTVAILADWRWTLIAISAAPLLAIPMGLLQNVVRRTTRTARQVAAGLSTRLDEIFHGATTIKLSGTEAREAGRFRDENSGFVKAQTRSEAGQAAIPALIDIVAGIGFFGVLMYGGNQIIAGEKTVGEFMSFFTAMALVFDPLRRLGNVSGAWQAARASLERVYELFQMRPSITSPQSPTALPMAVKDADIEFSDVQFSYNDTQVLHGTSFVAKAGETTAFVGASGAGKSTIFHLLTRLADPQGGAITLGGVQSRALDLEVLRSQLSVVSQDALLFDESLRDNILLGGEASERALKAALKAAHVTDFLGKLEDGLDTRVGPRGSGLSGGQRQRVAIARAILRNRPILLLDEATSALDAQSEKVVQDALEKLSEGRTTLVIAHRLSTIRNAHKIVVMDKGRVVEEGTHDALIELGGVYADLHRLQSAESKLISAGTLSPNAQGQRPTDSAQATTGSGLLAKTSRAFGNVMNLLSRPRG